MNLHWQLRWLRFKLKLGLKYKDGICYRTTYPYSLTEHFVKWPKFSGYLACPVPAPAGCTDAVKAYYTWHHDKNAMWSKNHPYGKLRLELLDFLIEETR